MHSPSIMASTLGDTVPVGLDTLSGATDGSSHISNSKPPDFSCEESEKKTDVLGDSATLTDGLEE